MWYLMLIASASSTCQPKWLKLEYNNLYIPPELPAGFKTVFCLTELPIFLIDFDGDEYKAIIDGINYNLNL